MAPIQASIHVNAMPAVARRFRDGIALPLPQWGIHTGGRGCARLTANESEAAIASSTAGAATKLALDDESRSAAPPELEAILPITVSCARFCRKPGVPPTIPRAGADGAPDSLERPPRHPGPVRLAFFLRQHRQHSGSGLLN
jgi:hypothetical protein